MLSDTNEFLSLILKNNNINSENKKEDDKELRIFDTEQKIKKIIYSENSEDDKNDNNNDNKIINKRIKVINNNLREETNRINKKEDNSEYKIFRGQKSEAFEDLKAQYVKNYIKLNFEKINKNESINCFNYFCYMLRCKKIKSKIKFYEDLRRLIISEENMFQNYLNINKLLEFHQFN